MAEKRNDMTGEYYSHKRTTLLYSTALFILALPGVHFSENKVLGLDLGSISPGVILSAVCCVATYYFVNFIFIWRHEAGSYLRAERTGQREIMEKITQQIKTIGEQSEIVTGFAKAAADAVEWAKSSLDTANDPAMQADHLNTQYTAGIALDANSPEVISATSYTTVYLSELGKGQPELNRAINGLKDALNEQARLAAAVLFSQLYHKTFQPATDRLLGTEKVRELALIAGPAFEEANAELGKAVEEVKRFRKDLAGSTRMTKARLVLIDLGAPVLVFALGVISVAVHAWPMILDLSRALPGLR